VEELREAAEVGGAGATPGRALVTRYKDVKAMPVEWLWRGRVPLGMVTVLEGDPGLGKSTVMLDLAARLSRGDVMPDGSPGPEAAGVVILSAEDDPAHVIRPRLDAAGADVSRIAMVRINDQGNGLREPMLTPEDLAAVESAMQQVGRGCSSWTRSWPTCRRT